MRRPADDATVVLRRPPVPPPRRRSPWPAVAGFCGLALVAGLAVWDWLGRAPAPTQPPPAGLEGVAPVAPRHVARIAGPLAILENRAETLTVFRLEPNHAIVVLDFPTLLQQGRMLNRVAALVEKAGLPRDQVLDDTTLAGAIAARGESPESFYFGHNYRASDLVRFFTLAAAQGVVLNDEERRLAAILDDLGIAPRGPDGLPRLAEEAAIVTVPGLAAAAPERGVAFAIDQSVREAILRHELSHGEFFTNKAYAEHVARWWQDRLSPRERTAFRRFLAEGGYDPELEEVMMNEAMAYLMHTPNPGFFAPDAVGLDAAAVERLRAGFTQGLPETWLFSVPWPDR